ncbi:MAG: hypothetical protein RL748_2036 [Pseudomonadota bacterium]
MDFFASNEQVEHLEADLAQAHAGQRVRPLVALAWALRERDSVRAIQLADEADALLQSIVAETTKIRGLRLRLLLLRAEITYFDGEVVAACVLLDAAMQGFTQMHDALGSADACWLRGWISYFSGCMSEASQDFDAMACSAAGHDPVRHALAQVALARNVVFTDVARARACWGQHFTDLAVADTTQHPGAQCWVQDFLGILALQSGDYVVSIRHYSQVWALAQLSGQVRRATIASRNIGDAFNKLGDHHSALEWLQRGVQLAREKSSSKAIGECLTQSADALCRLQRYDSAWETLQEALALIAPMTQSRAYALALHGLGEVELARQQYQSALAVYQLLQPRAERLRNPELLSHALCGQARALLALDQNQAALQIAQRAWALAAGRVNEQIAALRVLAAIDACQSRAAMAAQSGVQSGVQSDQQADKQSDRQTESPAENQAAATALDYLQQARQLAQGAGNDTLAGELLHSMAQHHAAIGHFEQAWQLGRQAAQARERIHARQNSQRTEAMQISHQTERAEAQQAQQRELASEARRAELLQQTSDTLAHLGAIGQEITAHLALDRVCQVINHHLNRLLPVNVFALAIWDDQQRGLNCIFCIEDGIIKPNIRIPDYIIDPAREKYFGHNDVLLVDRDPYPNELAWPDFLTPTSCRLFAPLCLGDKMLGMMTIQSRQRHVYGTREKMVFRTLCAYAAIAISNAYAHGELAEAHRQLQESQRQMVLQGKMAGLGSLTAGVAHEINNPTNFVHVAAQNQRADLARFEKFVDDLVEAEAAPEVLQGFKQHFARMNDNVATMLNGTARIKAIVKDLRSFTRLDAEQKTAVRLDDCLVSTLNLVRTSWLEKVDFITEFAPVPEIECWPALLNQVFMNLLVNACQAIEEKTLQAAPSVRGKLVLRLFQQGESLIVQFEDTGIGMSEAVQAHILEPFYTTKTTGKGTGLGLSIAFDIVQKHGGIIGFQSTPGEGSCFTIQLPLA